jgi:hypothetical protein
MFEPSTVIFILGTFLIAGLTKGIIGLGLPTISLALLTIVTNLPTSMALLLVPSGHRGWKILGNFNQALAFIPYGYLHSMVWGNGPVKCRTQTSISTPWGSVNDLCSY